MALKIGLGTAQFGLDYGATNARGKISGEAAANILTAARGHGIDLLDTAPAYGDAEAVIGKLIPEANTFRIITKSTVFSRDRVIGNAEIEHLKTTFLTSLAKLRRESVDGLLIHHASDLSRPGGDRLLDCVQTLKAEGLVRQIGVSIYTAAEIDAVMETFVPDILQAPVSLADQRLVRSGHLAALKREGVELHARSVFLQGVLLAPPDTLPASLSAIADDIRRIQDASKGPGVLAACLGFMSHRPEIDVAILGITSLSDLEEIASALALSEAMELDYEGMAIDDDWFLHPGNWTD